MSSIAEQIRAKIAAAQLIEAGTLLKVHGDKLSPEQKRRLKTDIKRQQDKAERLVLRAEKAENQGLIADSIALLEQAALLAADLPQLREKLDKLGETAILTRAVKNKAMRREQVPPPASSPSSSPVKKTVFFAVIIILLMIAVYLVGRSSSLKNSTPQLRNKPAEAEITPQPQDKAPLIPENQTASEPQAAPAPKQDSTALPPAGTEEVPSFQGIKKLPPMLEAPQASPPDEIQSIIPEDGTKIKALLPEMPDFLTPLENVADPDEQQATPTSSTAQKMATSQNLPKTYIIQPGDSLSLIAYRLFCNEKERVKLYEMNKDILESPRNLKPGTTIRIYSPIISIDNLCTE